MQENFLSPYQNHGVDFSLSFCSTFFKKFHKGLARTIRCLLKEHGPSEALLFSPKRDDSLDKFLLEVEASGMHFTITEAYDAEIWRRHKSIINGDHCWPNYEPDHCYPLLVSITRWTSFCVLLLPLLVYYLAFDLTFLIEYFKMEPSIIVKVMT